jgi:aspartate/methionine/tyrosine aminotransferase
VIGASCHPERLHARRAHPCTPGQDALLQAGDHVIVETPCYESALQVASSTGARVTQWERRYEDGWVHDLDALAGLICPATRLLYLNQPHNPTGTLMARPVFEDVIGLARPA